MTYLRNVWYMAAWAEEVRGGAMISRRLLDEQVVLFRDADGVPAALHERCPHRFAPLSRGSVNARGVKCGYHGLEFDRSSVCVHNPFGPTPPKAAKVRAYPLVEKFSVLWIWMGDVEKADPALIPDFSTMDADQFWVGKRYLHVKANYVLETDNIMDLSHIEFLHPTTLGSGSVASGETELLQEGDTVWSNRLIKEEILPDFLYAAMGIEPGTRVDRWVDVRWDAPANMLLIAGATPTGRPREEGSSAPSAHIFTPETATTSHYWFSISFPKAMGSMGEAIAEKQISDLQAPFQTEDLPMLEAQQNAIGDEPFWSLKPVLLPGDAGAVRARRVLESKIKSERTDAAAA